MTDGKTIWVVSSGALLKVNAKTNDVESLAAPVVPDDTTLALADDGMWAARWAAGMLYRLDPQTGKVQVQAALPSAVNIQFNGDEMWIGQENKQSMFKVDRSTGEIDPATQLAGSAYAVFGAGGDLWFTDHSWIKRLDPTTKEVTPVFDITGVATCASGAGGDFAGYVWTGCFEPEARERSIARIDLATRTVSAVVNLPPLHGGGVSTIGDHEWFVGVGSSRVDLQACKLEYSIVSPK